MSVNQRVLITVVAATLLISACLFAAPGEQSAGSIDWLKDIQSGRDELLGPAYWKMIAQRESTVKALIDIVRQPDLEKTRKQISTSMEILGTMRAKEAIDPLLDKIDFLEYGRLVTSRPTILSVDYLSVKMLIEIGNPAVEPAIMQLSKARKGLREVLLVVVLEKILTPECAKLRIEAERTKAAAKGADTQPFIDALAILAKPGSD